MAAPLSPAEIAAYRERGYACPLPAFSAAEAAGLRRRFDELRDRDGGTLSRATNTRPHLLARWIDEAIRDPRVLDPVESILGPDIFCWSSGFFAKRPGDGAFVSWHQDATYWGLSSPDVLTAWIALTPSTPETGCMRVVPGSHTRQVEHRDTFAQSNLLSRGQEIAVEVDEAAAADLALAPGEMSLHHVLIVHGSAPNRGEEWRIGLAVRYVAAHVRQVAGERDSAALVRGKDRFGHFEHERRPRFDFAPDAVAHHDEVQARSNRIVATGARQALRAT